MKPDALGLLTMGFMPIVAPLRAGCITFALPFIVGALGAKPEEGSQEGEQWSLSRSRFLRILLYVSMAAILKTVCQRKGVVLCS